MRFYSQKDPIGESAAQRLPVNCKSVKNKVRLLCLTRLHLLDFSAQSQLKILTPCSGRGSGRLHELDPCCLFICFRLFLVTEARNGCAVGLGVSVKAARYVSASGCP